MEWLAEDAHPSLYGIHLLIHIHIHGICSNANMSEPLGGDLTSRAHTHAAHSGMMELEIKNGSYEVRLTRKKTLEEMQPCRKAGCGERLRKAEEVFAVARAKVWIAVLQVWTGKELAEGSMSVVEGRIEYHKRGRFVDAASNSRGGAWIWIGRGLNCRTRQI